MSGIYDQDADPSYQPGDLADALHDYVLHPAGPFVEVVRRKTWFDRLRSSDLLRLIPVILALILSVALVVIGYQWGASSAVCHSATEDSVITDCDYRDDGWYEE